jgi:hypothetical protein
MWLVKWILIATLVVGCADSAPEPEAESSAAPEQSVNEPPGISSIEIYPEEPTVDETISLVVDVQDPERDALDIHVEWWRNDALLKEGADLKLHAGELARGDEIFARVYVSDDESEVSADSPTVTIQNRAPRVVSLDLRPRVPTGADNLMAVARAEDPEDDDVHLAYRWFRNDELIEGQRQASLDASLIGRGDAMRVEVKALDEESEGDWVTSRIVMVQNAPPQITSEPSYSLSPTGHYEYAIGAEDPDGDGPLRYELVEGPAGMKVDLVTGLVSWHVPPNARGDYAIEVSVNDPHGGAANQRYAIEVRWDDAPAAPDEEPLPDQGELLVDDDEEEGL